MVMRTNATPSFQTGIIIPNSIAKGPPGNLKELITAHESEGARVIFSKVNGGIELMDELNIKVKVDRHELDKIKLLTESQCLTKILQVVPPMVKIDGPLLGIPVLVVLKEFMYNSYLHLIPELNGGPTRSNGNLIRFLERKASWSLAFQWCKGKTTRWLAAADFSW